MNYYLLINQKKKKKKKKKFVHGLSLRIFPFTISQIIKLLKYIKLYTWVPVYSVDTFIHGNKYFFTILDDYSRYGWVFFI